jgi:hypothetical protein
MASNTVKSPAGESIELVDDEDWMEATGAPWEGLRQWKGGRKPEVIRALWEHGPFTDPKSGQATRKLMDYISSNYVVDDLSNKPGSLSTLMATPVNAPAFYRETNGKRTHSIRLAALPQVWYRKLLDDIGPEEPSTNGAAPEAVSQAPVVPQDSPEVPAGTNGAGDWSDADWAALELDAPTVYETEPPLELHVANQVALSLLTTVVEIITAGSADTTQLSGSRRIQEEMQQAQHLLSQRLMENDKLRRQLREAGDSITALRRERDGLRTRLRMTEHNLSEVLKGETAQVVHSEIQKRVDQFMRTTPTPKGD